MRSLACFLLGIAGCLAGTGAQAQRESIVSCLKGWELPALRLPYFPRYRPVDCARADPPKETAPRYFSGGARSLKLSLEPNLTPMTAALGHAIEPGVAIDAALAHFDTWLKANGFQRTDAAEAGGSTPPRNASYEAQRAQGKMRVSLSWPRAERFVIELEQAGGLRAGVAVRKPAADFRFQDTLVDLFKLPDTELIKEEVRFGDQQIVPVDNPLLRKRLASYEEGVRLFLPEKQLSYKVPKGVNATEAELALREALKQAGWILQPGTNSSTLHFPAAGRNIELGVRFWFDGYIGYDVAQLTVRDPLFQRHQASVQASFESLGQYTFAPGLQSSGSLAEDSALRIAEASYFMESLRSRTHKDSKYSVEITPVAADAAATARAKEMASKVKDELARRGWEASRILISPDPVTPGPEAAGLGAGVRLGFYECGTRSVDRPGGAVPTCVCWREPAQRVTRPGECS